MAKVKRLPVFEIVETRIRLLRGQRVMLDSDLAELYGVETKGLNKAVKRNRERFPSDFMFQLTPAEAADMRFQIGTASADPDESKRFQFGTGSRRNVRYLPFAFTQEGIAMLSGVLRSPRAVAVNVAIMRAFVRFRALLLSNEDLAKKVAALEKKALLQDEDIRSIFEALRELLNPQPQLPAKPGEIGFHVKGQTARRLQ